jgi:tripartite-type tricarboxylate transporter receptor subunit TctC
MIVNPAACAIAAALALPLTAQAAAGFPERPVRLIVPFAPGGSSDFTARVLQPRLAEQLGQQVVIDNRSGAAGNIGVEVAARANADGYTLLFGNVGTIAINPGLYPAFPVQPLRDLTAIIEVADLPSVLVVNTTVPVANVRELIDYAKKSAGQLNFAGTGSSNRIDSESFIRAAGIRMVHVPYKGGAGPAIIGLLANETQVMFSLLSACSSFVKQGRLKALGVTATKRNAALLDVPTLPEAGFAAMKSGSWQGLFAPRATPAAVVTQLFASTTRAMDHPELRKRLADAGIDIVVSASPADFTAFIKAETARFAGVIKEAGITAD